MVKTQNSLVSLVKCDTYEYDTVHAKTVKAIDSVYYKTNKDDYLKPKVLRLTKSN